MTTRAEPAPSIAEGPAAGAAAPRPWPVRWAPLVVAVFVVVGVLLATHTPALAIVRYAVYALLAVLLPGTLVYRTLRRTPHTLVEDLAVGAALGLVLELAAWTAFAAFGAQRWLWLWPLAVIVPYAAVPRLRRHWRVRGHRPVPVAWSWSVSAVVVWFTGYLAESFLMRNPILPTGEQQYQYIDLAFQMSIAGETTHNLPVDVPQVAGEPLHYHWFGFAHMGAASLISGVDLPTVFFRLAVTALCALAVVLVACAGWRVSGRPYAGAAAAALMFGVGEFGFENGVRQLFGTQATFIVWGSPSMTYSWVLLLPLLAVLGDRIGRAADSDVPPLGPGAWVLAGLFLFAQTGAKASAVPVVGVALGVTALVPLVVRRRLVWPVIAAGILAGMAQAFATVVLFAFEKHGLTAAAFSGLTPYLAGGETRSALAQGALGVGVFVAFVLNMQLRLAGIPALLWQRRGRLSPVETFLLAGAVGGPAIYLATAHPGSSNQYFTRSGFAFGVLLSGWGYAVAVERARLSHRAGRALAASAAAFAAALIAIQLYEAPARVDTQAAYAPLVSLWSWATALGLTGVVAALAWSAAGDRWRGLRGRGGVVLLTGVLLAGAPGLVTDAQAAARNPNGGAYAVVPMPRSRVEAARWVYAHSRPDDVLATNDHCFQIVQGYCDSRTFWLSAYAERSVLLEGWAFAPRMITSGGSPFGAFWDAERQRLNDEAFRAPTAAALGELRDRYGVRWLVADRRTEPESATLASLAELRFDNGQVAVYQLR